MDDNLKFYLELHHVNNYEYFGQFGDTAVRHRGLNLYPQNGAEKIRDAMCF